MPKFTISPNSRFAKFIFYLERIYRKNKLQINLLYFITLFSGMDKIVASSLDKNKNHLNETLIMLPAIVTGLQFLFYYGYKQGLRPLIEYSGVGRNPKPFSLKEFTNDGIRPLDTKGDLLFTDFTFSDAL